MVQSLRKFTHLGLYEELSLALCNACQQHLSREPRHEAFPMKLEKHCPLSFPAHS